MNFGLECECLLSKFVDDRVTLCSLDIFLCRSLLECYGAVGCLKIDDLHC